MTEFTYHQPKIEQAAERAAGIFSLYGWEWGSVFTGGTYVPTKNDIQESYERLRTSIIERHSPEDMNTTHTITSGRLTVTWWPDGTWLYGVNLATEECPMTTPVVAGAYQSHSTLGLETGELYVQEIHMGRGEFEYTVNEWRGYHGEVRAGPFPTEQEAIHEWRYYNG